MRWTGLVVGSVPGQMYVYIDPIGIFGVILAVLMIFAGFATLIAVVRRHAVFAMGLDTLFAGDVLQLSTFALLVGWSFLARRDGPAHKRLMTLGTVALLGPALARWPCPEASERMPSDKTGLGLGEFNFQGVRRHVGGVTPILAADGRRGILINQTYRPIRVSRRNS
jgi:hypothetical protein